MRFNKAFFRFAGCEAMELKIQQLTFPKNIFIFIYFTVFWDLTFHERAEQLSFIYIYAMFHVWASMRIQSLSILDFNIIRCDFPQIHITTHKYNFEYGKRI